MTNANTIQQVSEQATPRGGASRSRSLSVLATGLAVKSSLGTLYSIHAHNVNAAARYLKVYDKAVPTASDEPMLTLLLSPGANQFLFPKGVFFPTAIGIRATTGLADADTNAPSANETIVNITFK